MTTPVAPVLTETFTDADNASWATTEWTQSTKPGYAAYTASILSNAGAIIPTSTAFAQGAAAQVLHAAAWKDTAFQEFDLSVTIGKALNLYPGILFCWDGSISSPNGYLVGLNKNATTIGIYKITNGTVGSSLGSVTGTATNRRLRVRFSYAFGTSRIEARSWAASAGESGTWTSASDSTYTSGRIALVSWTGGTIGTGFTATSSDYVTFDDLQLSRIGTSAPASVSGTPTAAILTANNSTTDGTSYTTASVSPTAGRAWFAFITHVGSAAATMSVSGAGLTWTQVTAVQYATGARRTAVFQGTGTPSAGAITFSTGAGNTMTNAHWYIVEVTGASSGGTDTLPTASLNPLVSSATVVSTSTTATVTQSTTSLPDVSPFALILGCFGANLNTTNNQFSPVSPMTELSEQFSLTPTLNSCLVSSEGLATNTTCSVTQSSGASCGGVAIVIQPSIQYSPLDGSNAGTGIAG